MKTTTLILVLLFSLAKAQNPNFPTVNVWRVYPQNVCTGDTLYVDFKFSPPQQGTVTTANWLLKCATSNSVVWSGNYNYFYTLPKETYPQIAWNDSCYLIKFIVGGLTSFGTCTVTSSGYPGTFYLNNCATGIQNNTSGEALNATYYDLQGNQIAKRPNELIIEQVGLIRRKVIITD